MMERGRGIGKELLDRLCAAFGVNEESFTRQEAQENQTANNKLPTVTRMIHLELETMPEYEQLHLLAYIVENKIRKLEEQLEQKKTQDSAVR